MSEKEFRIRFAVFEVSAEAHELRKSGIRVKLEDQPFELLLALLEKPGEVVTRAKLQQRLWPDGTFVDFEKSVTKAVNKVRTALDDSATTPRFVETVSRRGYRFIAPVTYIVDPLGRAQPSDEQVETPLPASAPLVIDPAHDPAAAKSAPVRAKPRRLRTWLIGAGLTALLAAAGALSLGTVRRRVGGAAGVPRLQSLAVLPIENLTGNSAFEYLADSFTDDLTSELGRIGSLRVISRTSMSRYKNIGKMLPDIARELGLDGLVEGSIQRSQAQLRINVKLLLASADRQLWTESYLGEAARGASFGWITAQAVAHQVGARFTAEPAVNTAAAPNPQAYDAYVRGRHLWNLRGADRLNQATTYFEQAVRDDPRFALAWSGLADCYSIGWRRPIDGITAEKYARKAVELAPDLAETQVSLAFSRLVQYRWEEAVVGLRRAIGLSPNYVPAHQFYTIYLLAAGRLNEALAENDRALQLDPFSLPVNNLRGWVLTSLRRHGDALEHLRNAVALDPEDNALRWQLVRIYWLQHRASEALAVEKEAGLVSARHGNETIMRGMPEIERTLAREGFRAACLKNTKLLELAYPDLTPENIPLQYGILEDSGKVLEWIERLRDSYGMIMILSSVPEFDFIRADGRFQQMQRRFGVKP